MIKKEEIRQLLAENVCLDVYYCKDEAYIKHDLGIDSLSLLSFVTELYEEYNIGISEDEEKQILSRVTTIGDLLEEVKNYVEAKIS